MGKLPGALGFAGRASPPGAWRREEPLDPSVPPWHLPLRCPLSASRESLSNPRSRGREPSGNAAKTPRITFQGLFAVAKVGLALKAGAVFAALSSQFKDLFPLSALKMVFSTFILCHQI